MPPSAIKRNILPRGAIIAFREFDDTFYHFQHILRKNNASDSLPPALPGYSHDGEIAIIGVAAASMKSKRFSAARYATVSDRDGNFAASCRPS